MRAAIYCRISQDQTGEGLGVARQLEDCVAKAEELNWIVTEVYSDNDISATSGKPRPEYRRMLCAIAANEVDAVICWHPDRLYRRMQDLTELLEVVRAAGTRIATVKAGDLDLTTDTGQMMAEILASVAGYEGRAKSARWKRSVRQRREAGQMPNSRARLYGYDRDGNVIPDEADAIRWMAEQVRLGTSGNGVVREANARGYRTTEGNMWLRASLKRMLINPRLAGWATLRGDIMARGNWEPILDEEIWQAVRAALTVHNGNPERPRVALLLGLIFCGGCGAAMVTGSRMNKRGETVRTYRCTRVPGRGGCGKISARADAVEEVAENYAREKVLTTPIQARLTQLRSQPADQSAEVGELEVRIRELEHTLDQPGVPVDTILRAIDRAKERQSTLLAQMRPTIAVPRNARDWPTDLRRRRALVELAVGRVEIAPGSTPGQFSAERVTIDPPD